MRPTGEEEPYINADFQLLDLEYHNDFEGQKAKVIAVVLSSIYTEYNKAIGKRDNLPILA